MDFKGQKAGAESALLKARELDPQNPQYTIALIQFYLKYKLFKKAKILALEYKQDFPQDTSVNDILQYIDAQMQVE